MLGDPQEALAAHRDCVCPPGPATPENASCSRVDTRPALAVMTPGGVAVGRSVQYVRLPSGSGQMLMPWIKGCHLSRLVCGPSPVSFFSFLSLIFFATLTSDACIFPCLTGVLFLFISEVFVRPQTNQNLPPFLSEIPCMLRCF